MKIKNPINAAYALLLTSIARAETGGENATARFIKGCLKANIMPTYMMSPNDKQGQPDATTRSTCTPAEYIQQGIAYASGMGNCAPRLTVTTNAELYALSALQLKKKHDESKALLKKTTDAAGKKAMAKECTLYAETRKAKSALASKVSSKLRDKSLVLVNAYADQAKHIALQEGKTTKEANEARQAKKDELLESMGKGKPASKEEKDKDVVKQQAKNLLDALQKAETPPANVNKLIAELNKLIK